LLFKLQNSYFLKSQTIDEIHSNFLRRLIWREQARSLPGAIPRHLTSICLSLIFVRLLNKLFIKEMRLPGLRREDGLHPPATRQLPGAPWLTLPATEQAKGDSPLMKP